MVADAVRLGKRLNYRGVGTVEFILSGDNYYFLEVNPRLQVEHPVTEMVTGIDIVELMLRIAAGRRIAVYATMTSGARGHAVEARICAEDPADNFLPCTGDLAYVGFPDAGVRVESGVESGSTVSPYYNSMLAKLITHAETRDKALDQLSRALDQTSIFGITTNQGFLARLIELPETRNATFHTRLIDEQIDQLVGKTMAPGRRGAGAGSLFLDDAAAPRRRQSCGKIPWQSREITAWQMAAGDDGLSPIPILHLEASRRQRGDPVCAAAGGRQHDRQRQRRQTLGRLVAACRGDSVTAIVGGRREAVRIQPAAIRYFRPRSPWRCTH